MAKKITEDIKPDAPATDDAPVDNSKFVITAPPEQVSEKPSVDVTPAPADEQPSNHHGLWPTAFGQRVRGDAFEGVGTIVRYDDITCIVTADEDGEDYVVARAELGVVEG